MRTLIQCGVCCRLVLAISLWLVSNYRSAAADQPIAAFQFDEPRSIVTIPLVSQEGEFNFVIDTGASVSFYSSAMKWPEKPVKIEVIRTAGGDRKLPLFRRPASSIGPIKLRDDDLVAVIDFSDLSKVIGRPIHGMLGMDVLKQFVVQLDFDRQAVRFFESLPFDCGVRFPIEKSSLIGCPAMTLELPNGKFNALIDTGANGEFDISLARWRDLDERGGHLSRHRVAQAQTAGGVIQSREALLTGLRVGQNSFENLQINVGRVEMMGMGFLSRFIVTFDFPGNAIYLKPSRYFATPLPRDASGISILRQENQIVVYSVREDSPAAKHGIHKGDVILEIERRKAEDWTLFNLRNTLSKPGDTVRLTIERERQRVKVELELADY